MNSILISMLVNMGDVVMMTAAIDLIRQQYPQARIGVIARQDGLAILNHHPLIDELIVYAYRSKSFLGGLGELVKKIKTGRYEVFLSLDRRPRSALAAFLAKIPKRIGPNILYEGSCPKWWTTILFTKTVELTQQECRADQTEMFLLVARRALSLSGSGRITLPKPLEESVKKVKAWLPDENQTVIGLCVKTRDLKKTWPKAGFKQLIARLKQTHRVLIYVIGGADEVAYVDALLADFSSDAVVNLAGKTSLTDLMALAKQTDLFVGPDNGAMHLMGNSGVERVICLLVSTTAEKIETSLSKAQFIALSAQEDSSSTQAVQAGRLSQEVDAVFNLIEKAW